MARRSRSGSQRRHRFWAGFTSCLDGNVPILVPDASVKFALVSAELGSLADESYTQQRLRGRYALDVAASGAGSRLAVGIGWGIIPESLGNAQVAGTADASLPGPITDPAFGWIWLDYALPFGDNGAIRLGDVTSLQRSPVMDSKAQRVVKAGETVAAVIEFFNCGGAASGQTAFAAAIIGRFLVLE